MLASIVKHENRFLDNSNYSGVREEKSNETIRNWNSDRPSPEN